MKNGDSRTQIDRHGGCKDGSKFLSQKGLWNGERLGSIMDMIDNSKSTHHRILITTRTRETAIRAYDLDRQDKQNV